MYVNAIKQVLQSRGIKASIKYGYINYVVEAQKVKKKINLMRYVKFVQRAEQHCMVYMSVIANVCVWYTSCGSN